MGIVRGCSLLFSLKMRTDRFVRFGAHTRNSALLPSRTEAPKRSSHGLQVDLSDIRGALDLALNMHQHGNRQMRKGGSDREGAVSIPLNRSHSIAGKHVAILAGRKLLAQDDLRVSPSFGADGEADIRLKLCKEPSGQHQDCGSAEGTGESNQVPVLLPYRT